MVLFTTSAARKSSVLKVRQFLNIALTQGPLGKKETAWHIIIPFVALTAFNFNFIFVQIFIPFMRYFPVIFYEKPAFDQEFVALTSLPKRKA